ncbi:Cna protein B-type domain-containing protein [Bifidobacterium pseudolongum subsp. globosum]|uniref:Fimbrial subunit-like protein n=2 Tax=Bifidobacterium pseudolongum TaxID=1694 RepID=A0A223AB64_9BIFI|nr:SpaA isopeptide-forming pilin-related protein [Bifidobacterium pseudolongum]ASS31186.1 fimbrial subunit-like protein [Bifidobacterium pseudolongum]PKU90133.1 Cna protein B-type domain-containing protein [Bifidobacterium pseudolongum subsp. globosum]PKV05122.1 Cna protein B-type domain-containing protein [Bifidobacterium pseudolongum subsp. globosum]
MRMKHGSDRGPTISVKPRLLAAFTAVAMMFATAVPALLPRTALADDYDANITANGGTCSPMDIELGDTNQTAKEDTGVATWVGRDMYVGGRPSNTSALNGSNNPSQSYAVEAEGLTIVNGKLAMHPKKASWGKNGFRFGTVGFGAQFRPNVGSTALVVANSTGVSAIGTMPAIGTPDTSSAVSVGAWGHGSFVGNGNEAGNNWYQAQLSGDKTKIQSPDESSQKDRASVIGYYAGTGKDEDTVHWNAPSNVLENVNGTNYSNYNNTKSNYTKNIQDQSQWMYNMTETGTVTTREVTSGHHWRNKYNNGDINYKFEFNETHKEKVLVFTGDGTSHMQAFNLKASMLNSTGYSGISYDFRNFPDDASIVINLVNDDGTPYAGDITYHNGWQFWWTPSAKADTAADKLTEIGNGYFQNASDTAKKAYSVASQAIMWNFGKTQNLSIRGGTYNGQVDKGTGVQEIGTATDQLGDDPAAAMLGSIMVPHGSFDDHVTTNGRVWVGQDFMMNNPASVKSFNEGNSASIIDMDQERHNFRWYGSLSTSCSTIDWTKVGENKDPNTGENVPLGGTTWAVYNNLDAAKANSTTMATNTGTDANPNFTAGRLFTVTDNISSSGDLNPIAGAFQLQKLLPNTNYYIRETATNNNAYKVNSNIYHFQTKNSGTTTNTFVRVLDAQGNEISDPEDKLITSNGSIIDPLNGSSIEWGKTKNGEFAGLAGSEWVLTKTGTPQQQWLIKDDGKPITSLKIYDGEQEAPGTMNVTQGQPFNLSAVVLPAEANQHVEWTADPREGVSISASDNGRSVEIVAQKIPPAGGNFLLTAIAADGTHQDSITIHVNPVEVKSITVTPQNPTVMKDGTLQLTAKVIGVDGKELSLTPEWVSDDEGIATVDATGKVTGVSTGSVTITATAGSRTATTTVTVLEGTRIYADTDWANVEIYAWIEESNGTKTKLEGDWPGAAMTKDDNTGLWYHLVKTTQPFYVIINSDGKQTGDTKIDASETNNTFKLTGIENDKNKAATVNSFDPYARGNNVQSLSNAPRKAKAARAGDTTPTWSHIDTTGWGDDKKLKDQNPNMGQFKIDGLSAGTYYLQENKAPDDYFINPTVYTITIDANGTVTWTPKPETDSNGLHWISDAPTEFNWDKVDAGYSADDTDPKRNPIAGSKWRLEKFKAPATAGANGTYETNIAEIKDCTSDDQSGCVTDKDHEAGKFKLTGLALGKYRLVETEAPTGYTKLDTYYYFELSTMDPANPLPVKWTAGTEDSWDKQTGSYKGTTAKSEKAVEVNAAPNYRSPGDVYWGKVSSELNSENKHVYLGGSAWEVTYTPATGDSGQSVTVQIADCVKSGGKETGTCTAAEDDPAWAYDAYPAEGRIGFRNLPWGTYTMTETKAPDGYNVDSETVYTFTVDATHLENVKIYKQVTNGDPVEIPPASNPEGAELPDYPNQVISNTPGVVLPATGGEGNTLIVLFGFALIAISMLGCGVAMRKRI